MLGISNKVLKTQWISSLVLIISLSWRLPQPLTPPCRIWRKKYYHWATAACIWQLL